MLTIFWYYLRDTTHVNAKQINAAPWLAPAI